MWDYHNKNYWYQDVCNSKSLIATSALSALLSWYFKYIATSLIWSNQRCTKQAWPKYNLKIYQKFTHQVCCTTEALTIRLPYFQNRETYVCSLSNLSSSKGTIFVFLFCFFNQYQQTYPDNEMWIICGFNPDYL